jgi:hypothetical protein
MMFTTLSAKLAGMKAKLVAGTVVAVAALMMAAPAAQAQHVAFGVSIGAPVYVAPAPQVVYSGPGYYGGYYVRDYDAWRARYNWDHRFDRHDFDRRDFARRDFDRDRHFGRSERFDRR